MISYGHIPSIPEYFQEFINSSINLEETPMICCPFHNETSPSFTYSREKGLWRCWGACNVGGNVFALHQKNFKFRTRQQAKEHLLEIYHVKSSDLLNPATISVNEDRINNEVLYQRAILLSSNIPKRWLELDYVMSKFPVDYIELSMLVDKWKMEMVV